MHSTIGRAFPLRRPWTTFDPFLFCVHHVDAYPRGDGSLAPASPLSGRDVGMDFSGRDGWSMYHGHRVPGFPQHPHRGFETVTFVRSGYVDHSDSLGASARYGMGDVQWLTAGAGVVHSEMFPLLRSDRDNPLELFQIWLNLPPADKLADPHFTMLWDEDIPRLTDTDANGNRSVVTVVAGRIGDAVPPDPPPRSWASNPDNDVAVWLVELDAGASWTTPAARIGSQRALYSFGSTPVTVGADTLPAHHGAPMTNHAVTLAASSGPATCLILAGRPIGAPVANHGPFVMNTDRELEQAFRDYRTTGFGGWPWPSDDPTHGDRPRRFARTSDGEIEPRSTAGRP